MSEMEEKIKFSPEALNEFRAFKRDRAAEYILLTVSASLLVGSTFSTDRNTRIALAGASVVTAGIAIPLAIGAGKHLGRTVWIHNRDILTR